MDTFPRLTRIHPAQRVRLQLFFLCWLIPLRFLISISSKHRCFLIFLCLQVEIPIFFFFVAYPSAWSLEACVGADWFVESIWCKNMLIVQHNNGLHSIALFYFSQLFIFFRYHHFRGERYGYSLSLSPTELYEIFERSLRNMFFRHKNYAPWLQNFGVV